jgi:acetolactate decarboxylase
MAVRGLIETPATRNGRNLLSNRFFYKNGTANSHIMRGDWPKSGDRSHGALLEEPICLELHMPVVNAEIPTALKIALDKEAARLGTETSDVVTAALSEYLGVPAHTLFQVSTSGARVAGVSDRDVSVRSILEHGDFGLGTFADFGGEMLVLDGRVYGVRGGGSVSEASRETGAPFAVVTRFSPEVDTAVSPVRSFKDLGERCDAYRTSGNIFYAIRLDGRFKRVRASPGSGLVEAADAQSEFSFTDIDGTLVGVWSPAFSSAFSVAGYHFHFISGDRRHGGHLLDVETAGLRLRVEALTDFHLALPSSEAFLKAELSKTTAEEQA